MGDIVTSIRLDEDKWKAAKIQAINEGITLTIFLDEALDMRLKAPRPPTQQHVAAVARKYRKRTDQ